MSQERGEITVRIVFEPEGDFPIQKMQDWLVAAIKGAPKYSRQGVITMGFYDEDGNYLGSDTTAAPGSRITPERKRSLEEAVGPDPDDQAA